MAKHFSIVSKPNTKLRASESPECFRFSRRADADLEMIASYIGRNDPSRAIS